MIANDKKYKILLIDDDEFLLDMHLRSCKEAGLETETLPSAEGDFIEKVLTLKPDLISLDIIMPGRDGFQAIELLKQDSRTKNIPVIMTSNMAQEEVLKRSFLLGAVDYINVNLYTPKKVAELFIQHLENPKEYNRITSKERKQLQQINKSTIPRQADVVWSAIPLILLKGFGKILLGLFIILIAGLLIWLVLAIGPLWIIALAVIGILLLLSKHF